jgi:hypothetical protein
MVPLCRSHTFRLFLGGIFTALVGFSYALATSDTSQSRAVRGEVDSRAVGSGLRFSNPFLLAGQDPSFPSGGDLASDPDAFDLGDACFGSQVVRYLTGLGGVRAYRFTSSSIGSATSPGLSLFRNGIVSGMVPSGSISPAFFTAVLTDAAGATRTGTFRLNAHDCSAEPLRFAMDRLPAAQVGNDYITNLEVINGTSANTTFSIMSGSVFLNGLALTQLELAGLTLFADGTLAGRPLASGTLTFTASALRGTTRALNRAGTAFDQTFTISIAAQSRIQSVLATTSVQVKSGRPGRDTVTYSALLNTDGVTARNFGGSTFVFRIFGATFSTTLDSFGQGRSGNLRVKLDGLKGSLRVQLKNADLSPFLPSASLISGVDRNFVVQIQIGQLFLGTEAIGFNVKNSRGRISLGYKLGKDIQLGGLFQIIDTRAADFVEGTAFKVRFLLSHVRGNTAQQFGSPQSATVSIGQGFTQTVSLFRGRGAFPPDGLRTLKINTKTKVGDLSTYPLTQAETGIPPAAQANGAQQTFLLGLDLTTSTLLFSGDASRRLIPFFFP